MDMPSTFLSITSVYEFAPADPLTLERQTKGYPELINGSITREQALEIIDLMDGEAWTKLKTLRTYTPKETTQPKSDTLRVLGHVDEIPECEAYALIYLSVAKLFILYAGQINGLLNIYQLDIPEQRIVDWYYFRKALSLYYYDHRRHIVSNYISSGEFGDMYLDKLLSE